jgi:hypothetical protein
MNSIIHGLLVLGATATFLGTVLQYLHTSS